MTHAIHRILLPTRFAALSRRAAEYVDQLMARFDAELHVVHVIPHTELIVDSGLPPVGVPVPGPAPKELLADSARQLQEFVRELFSPYAARTRTASVIGGITDEIVKYAAAHAIDLIVMGTHADGMVKRMVFGSVGKGVLESATCPVLLVPVRGAPR